MFNLSHDGFECYAIDCWAERVWTSWAESLPSASSQLMFGFINHSCKKSKKHFFANFQVSRPIIWFATNQPGKVNMFDWSSYKLFLFFWRKKQLHKVQPGIKMSIYTLASPSSWFGITYNFWNFASRNSSCATENEISSLLFFHSQHAKEQLASWGRSPSQLASKPYLFTYNDEIITLTQVLAAAVVEVNPKRLIWHAWKLLPNFWAHRGKKCKQYCFN